MNKSDLVGVLKSKKLALLVASVAVAGTLSVTKVQAAPEVTRYNGMDRYETAAKVCEDGWKTDTDNAVIVNGENFPDALSAAPLAKKLNAPILLTGSEILNPYTSAELTRLNVKNVYIVGGRGVVSQSIEDALKARKIKATRLGGSDRYETALQVAAKVGKKDEVAIINGNDFKDGMTMASIAGLKGMPIILTDGISMTSSVKKYLGNTSKMSQIYVVGDQNTISDSAISGLDNVKRIGSGNDYERNTSIIDAFQNELSTDTLYIASAKDFPDSLGASALAPNTASPVLFVDSPMDSSTQGFLKKHIVNKLKILGGTGSISYSAEIAAKGLPLAVGSTENLTDTIWQNEKYTPRPTMIITATDGNKKEVTVDWNLTKINTSKPGIYTFTGKIKGTDKIVYATLTVKPIPYKIDDLTRTANSRNNINLPTTISAQMTDGSTSQVPVTWDYGTQSTKKPGEYIFYGTVDKYSKKVKLTLTVSNSGSDSATIKTINNIKAHTTTKASYTLPTTVTAIMTDGSTQSMAVTWGSENKYATGVYTYDGTVSGYSGKVSLMLIVDGEGGKDPNDPNYPQNPDNPNATDLGELAAIMQNESYPSTVKDPTTGKQVAVTWTEAVSIDSTFVGGKASDTDMYIDDCRVAKFTLNGTISGNKKVKATIGIIPKILTLNVGGNTSTIQALVINVNKSNYPGGVFNMDNLASKVDTSINAIIKDSDGNRSPRKVHVLLWNPPVIDISDSNIYYVTATINHYSTPVTVTIKVTKN